MRPGYAVVRHAVLGAVWISAIAFDARVLAETGIDFDLSGQVSLESRWFPESAAYAGQSDHASGLVLEPELYFESAGGLGFSLTPFLRYDSADSRRSHADLREAYFLAYGEIGNGEWELRLGVDRVFWGVVESNHLVDIINQTDLIEHPDEEVELGQLMAHLTWSGEWGAAEFFVLPHHRERSFSGRDGRLRPSLIIDDDHATYENSRKERHVDFAVRYSHSLGPFDFGLSVFDGTSRDPSLRLKAGRDPDDALVLVPHYEQIRQFGLDVQMTIDSWLYKLEAIHRTGAQNLFYQEEDFTAYVVGGEYTFYGVWGSDADIGVLGEYTYDDREEAAANTFEDDWFVGGRFGFNDVQNTEFFTGFLQSRDHSTSALVIEFSRRIFDQWSMNMEMFAIFNADREDLQIYQVRRDSFLEFRLNYNF